MTIDISRALIIPGWMGDTELEWLAEQASRCKTIAEVGCWMGRSTVAMAENTKGTVFAVDHWEGSEEHHEELKDKPKGWLFEQFISNTLRFGTKVVQTPSESVKAAAWFASIPRQFDMIFLDASHGYVSVCKDILAWKPLLSPSGMLCGHDLRPSWPGVEQAVSELLPGWQKVPGDRNSIWWWKEQR